MYCRGLFPSQSVVLLLLCFVFQSASVSTSLLLGFLSGAFASVTNIPFDVAKSRIQGPQPVDNPFKYSTTTATLRIIVKEEGYGQELEIHVQGMILAF